MSPVFLYFRVPCVSCVPCVFLCSVFCVPCPPFSFKKHEVFGGVAFVSDLARKLGGSIASRDNMKGFLHAQDVKECDFL